MTDKVDNDELMQALAEKLQNIAKEMHETNELVSKLGFPSLNVSLNDPRWKERSMTGQIDDDMEKLDNVFYHPGGGHTAVKDAFDQVETQAKVMGLTYPKFMY